MRKLTLVFFGLVFSGFSLASAQSEFYAILSPPQTIQFPAMTTTLEVYTPGGGFLRGLKPQQVTLLENGRKLAVDELREVDAGVELIVAINAASPLALRDASGRSRYQKVSEALQDWANAASQPSTDRFNLLVNAGPPVADLEERSAWLTAFNAYQPDMRNSLPSSKSLETALMIASDPPDRSGMKRAILYITPPPEGESLAAFPGLVDLAARSGTRVFVWMIASESAFEGQGARELRRLAAETQGQFLAFSGGELIPDLEDYLAPLRSIYQIRYTSEIKQSGAQTLAALVETDEGPITSPSQSFQMTVLPPNPMFISPPALIVRTSPPESENPLQELGPQVHNVEAMIEFPDGYARPLNYTRLYIDGELVVERTQAPFDRFEWYLGDYTSSAQHTLRLEVEDHLGLRKSSLEIPVEIRVQLPSTDFWTGLIRKGALVNTSAAVLAGASLSLVFILARRRRGQPSGRKTNARRGELDPLTQPVHIQSETRSGQTDWQERLPWPKRASETPARAYLLRLGESNEPISGAPIPISGREMTIGRDPTQATCVLDAPSVDGLHARLRLDQNECYVLCDQDSVAGTWVNFAPISGEGIPLEQGDIIHFGRVPFRFSLSKPPSRPQVKVQPYQETL